jgi:hypothetical protein
MSGRKQARRVLVGKPDGKRLFGKPRYRREDNIKMDLQDMVLGGWTVLI